MTIVKNIDEYILVIKKVPAEICDNCGEYYLSNSITNKF
ncbi:YgiT-type zinc finger protein [Nostoc sp. CHAB 5844]|nr:YgiT-type zinc finger protein [Nostoc sp. CHAB 5844]